MSRRVVAVAPDLFFAARIAQTASLLGVELQAATPDRVLGLCRAHPPDLVILDLEAVGDPVGLARGIKAEPALGSVRLVGFCSHLNVALRASALAAGVDQVLPRSAFTRHLAEILGGEFLPRPDQGC